MKKRLLILGMLFFFFMIPKNAFAANNTANISLYDKDWNLIGQCLNSSLCSPHSADEMNKVKYVQLGVKTSIISGLKYRLDTTFWIGGWGSIHPTFNNPNLNYGNGGNRAYTQEYFNINWTRNQPLNSQLQTTWTRSFGYASNFTAIANSDYVLFEFYLNNDVSFGGIQLNVFNFGPVGTSTNDAISNSTNVIIQNQNQNFGRLEDKMNENTQAIKDLDKTQKEQLEQQKEQTDYMKDDTEPESDISSLGNVQGLLPPGPVDSLLNIPFSFLSILTSSFAGECKPLSGDFVFDSTLTIPCFSEIIYDDFPASLLIFVDIIPCTFMLIKYFKHLYKKVDRAVSMNSNSDDEWGVI